MERTQPSPGSSLANPLRRSSEPLSRILTAFLGIKDYIPLGNTYPLNIHKPCGLVGRPRLESNHPHKLNNPQAGESFPVSGEHLIAYQVLLLYKPLIHKSNQPMTSGWLTVG